MLSPIIIHESALELTQWVFSDLSALDFRGFADFKHISYTIHFSTLNDTPQLSECASFAQSVCWSEACLTSQINPLVHSEWSSHPAVASHTWSENIPPSSCHLSCCGTWTVSTAQFAVGRWVSPPARLCPAARSAGRPSWCGRSLWRGWAAGWCSLLFLWTTPGDSVEETRRQNATVHICTVYVWY